MSNSTEEPFNVFDWQRSLVEESFAQLRRISNLPSIYDKAQKVRKGVTPKEVVYEEDKLKIYRYLGKGDIKHKTPVLFVFALVNRPYIVDLKEGQKRCGKLCRRWV